MRESTAVGEGNELSKGIWALGTAQKSSVTALRADECCGFGLRSRKLAGQDGGCCALYSGRGAAKRSVQGHCGWRSVKRHELF